MAQDTVDAVVQCKDVDIKRSMDVLNCEMPDRYQKDRGKRFLRTIINKIRLKRSASVNISDPDPNFKVAYLGNVVTGWAKGDGCMEKPLATLWRNYTQSSRPEVSMQLTVSGGGLKATTRDHGLTEYWANRLTCCAAPQQFPRIFSWVYRHEGRRLKHELRCHAVLCTSATVARQVEAALKHSISLALAEFKRDKISRQNARLSLVNCIYENPSMPRRKILLSTGSHNYRPPLERSKSAPKLMSIEENLEESDDTFEGRPRNEIKRRVLRHHDSTSALLDKQRYLMLINNENKCKVSDGNTNSCDIETKNVKRKHSENINRVKFSDNVELSVDEKSTLILESLVEDSLNLDENTEPNWFNNLRNCTDVIPLDSDEGSLSSGCESASTVTSEQEHTVTPHNENETLNADAQVECAFKVGEAVSPRVPNLDRLTNLDLRKYCANILNDEVSLIPVGESHSDFSSLKVYKKRSISESGITTSVDITRENVENVDLNVEENGGDEGYDDIIDCTGSVANIVLV